MKNIPPISLLRLAQAKRLLLGCLAMLFVASTPAQALEIFYPVEGSTAEPGDSSPASGETSRDLENALNRLDFSWEGQAYRDAFSGDSSRAFRPQRFYYQNQMGLGYSDKTEGGIEYEARTSLRQTTDLTIYSNEDVKMTSVYGRIEDRDAWKLQLGDVAANLSRYAFNRSLEGAVADLNFHPSSLFDVKVTAAGGQTQRPIENRAAQRIAYGAGTAFTSVARTGAGPRLELAYGYGCADDKPGDSPQDQSLTDLRIGVHSFSYTARPLTSLTLRGEHGWSRGASDKRRSPTVSGSAFFTNLTWQSPFAAEASGFTRMLPTTITGNWDQADPFFLSSLGSASANQRNYTISSNFQFMDDLSANVNYTNSRDNIRSTAVNTNVNRATTVSLDAKPFTLIGAAGKQLPQPVRDLKFGANFRFNDRANTSRTVNTKIDDFSYSLSTSAWGALFSGTCQFQTTDDLAAPANDGDVRAWSVNVSRPYEIKKWALILSPSSGYRHNRDRQKNQGLSNLVQTCDVGLGIQWEELSSNVSYSVNSSDREPDGSDYTNHTFSSSLTYRPYAIPDFHVTASYTLTDNNTQGAVGYRQNSVNVTAGYSF